MTQKLDQRHEETKLSIRWQHFIWNISRFYVTVVVSWKYVTFSKHRSSSICNNKRRNHPWLQHFLQRRSDFQKVPHQILSKMNEITKNIKVRKHCLHIFPIWRKTFQISRLCQVNIFPILSQMSIQYVPPYININVKPMCFFNEYYCEYKIIWYMQIKTHTQANINEMLTYYTINLVLLLCFLYWNVIVLVKKDEWCT